MKLRKVLFLLVVIPVLAYGGARGILWYLVNSKGEELKNALAPVAALEYEHVQASLTGPLGIENISISPHALDDEVRIKSILVAADGPQEVYKLARAAWDDKLPERLRLSVNGITLSLDGELAFWMNKQTASGSGNNPFDTSCGGKASLGSDDLQQMGYEKLVTDLRLEYQFGRGEEGLGVFAQISTREMMSVRVSGNIPANSVSTSVQRLAQSEPELAYLSVTYGDDSYQKRKNEYCAKLEGITVADYVDASVESLKNFLLENDFRPSDELIAAYRKLLTGSPKLTMVLNPVEPLDLAALAAIDSSNPGQIPGFQVLIDDEPVTLGEIIEPEPETLVDANGAPQAPPDTYKETTIAELDQHLNRRIKVYTRDGKLHQAFLERVEPEQLVLTRHLVGGSATFTVPFTEVTGVLVLY
jgi:hypothetical protein